MIVFFHRGCDLIESYPFRKYKHWQLHFAAFFLVDYLPEFQICLSCWCSLLQAPYRQQWYLPSNDERAICFGCSAFQLNPPVLVSLICWIVYLCAETHWSFWSLSQAVQSAHSQFSLTNFLALLQRLFWWKFSGLSEAFLWSRAPTENPSSSCRPSLVVSFQKLKSQFFCSILDFLEFSLLEYGQSILNLYFESHVYAPLPNRSSFNHARQLGNLIAFHSNFDECLTQFHAFLDALVMEAKSTDHRALSTLLIDPVLPQSILNLRPFKLTLQSLNHVQKLLKVHFSDASYSLSISTLTIGIYFRKSYVFETAPYSAQKSR